MPATAPTATLPPIMRTLQSVASRGRRNSIVWMGDSLSHNVTLMVPTHMLAPERLAARLRALGYSVRARNFAKNGNTTGTTAAHMIARFREMLLYDNPNNNPPTPWPAAAVIFGGVNDPGNGITTAQTTANLRAMVKALKNGTTNFTSSWVSLPANQPEGTRYIVINDAALSGGVNPAGNVAVPTITGGGSGSAACWMARNGLAGEAGWSRVADLTPWCVPLIVLVTPQFINWASGGDTVDPGGTHSGQGGVYAAVDGAVKAAAAAEGVALCDLYAWLQQRIIDGKDPALTPTWHVANANQHFNVYGEDLVAQAVLETMAAQTETVNGIARSSLDALK
jgi:hypothetical protein